MVAQLPLHFLRVCGEGTSSYLSRLHAMKAVGKQVQVSPPHARADEGVMGSQPLVASEICGDGSAHPSAWDSERGKARLSQP